MLHVEQLFASPASQVPARFRIPLLRHSHYVTPPSPGTDATTDFRAFIRDGTGGAAAIFVRGWKFHPHNLYLRKHYLDNLIVFQRSPWHGYPLSGWLCVFFFFF